MGGGAATNTTVSTTLDRDALSLLVPLENNRAATPAVTPLSLSSNYHSDIYVA